MSISIPPESWHTQKTPQEWQAIQDQAIRDHRANPHDDEAMQAIRDSNEALNMYEQPAITAGKHTLDSGFGNPVEAVKGVAEGGIDALLSPFHLANTIYRRGGAAGVDEVVNGLKSIPGEIASGDPRRIGHVAGGVAGGMAAGAGIGAIVSKTGSVLGGAARIPGATADALDRIGRGGMEDMDEGGPTTMAPTPKSPSPKPTTPVLNLADRGHNGIKNYDPSVPDDPYGLGASDKSQNFIDKLRNDAGQPPPTNPDVIPWNQNPNNPNISSPLNPWNAPDRPMDILGRGSKPLSDADMQAILDDIMGPPKPPIRVPTKTSPAPEPEPTGPAPENVLKNQPGAESTFAKYLSPNLKQALTKALSASIFNGQKSATDNTGIDQ